MRALDDVGARCRTKILKTTTMVEVLYLAKITSISFVKQIAVIHLQ
jgi:hypothetical protein